MTTWFSWNLSIQSQPLPTRTHLKLDARRITSDRVAVRSGAGVVYVIRTHAGTKIGYTVSSVQQRFALQRKNEIRDWHFVGTLHPVLLERRLHQEFGFAKVYKGREYFYITDEAMRYIKGLVLFNTTPLHHFDFVEDAELWMKAVRSYPK